MKFKKFIKLIVSLAIILIVASVALVFFFGGEDDYEDYDDISYSDYDEDDYYDDDDDDIGFFSFFQNYYGNYDNQDDYQEAAREVFEDYNNELPPASEIKEGTWTIMYYLCGSDLESRAGFASDDMMDIANQATNPKIKMIAQTGGSKEWQNKGISSKNIERYELSNGKYTKVDSRELTSMGNPKTLSSFIQWTKENYPAERYMIVFWNHGSGSAYGVCFDELYQPKGKNPDSLSIVEMAQGLKDGGVIFDIIGYDTCLTATIEYDYAIAPYGRYVISSEETEPGEGWNYTDWVGYLNKNPKCSTEDLGKRIVNSYMDLCAKNDQDDTATLSLVDLSKIKNVYNAFVRMATEMSGNTSDITVFKNIKRDAKSARYFGTRTSNEGYNNMTDLGDMAKNLTEELGKGVTQPLIDAIKSAVVYEKHGDSRSEATGISVFYPVKSDAEELNLMAEGTTNGPYLAFIDAMCDYWTAPSWVYAKSEDSKALRTKNDISVSKSFAPIKSKDYSVKYKEYVNDDGYYTLKITSGLDSVDMVTFDLIYLWDDDSGSIYLGNDDDIIADWDKGIFVDNFNGTWITMDGEYVNAILMEENEYENIYTAPILLNGEETNLRFKYDFDDEEFHVIGAYDSTQSWGASSRKSRKLVPGDEITFLFDTYDSESDQSSTIENGTIIYSKDSVIEDDDLIDGNYYYIFTFYDIFDNEYQTEGVGFTVENGEIYINEYSD